VTKFAFISTNEYVPWGGSECCWAAAAERLARAGADVRISVKAWPEPVKHVELLRSLGCRIFHRVFPPSIPQRIKHRLLGEDHVSQHIRLCGNGADLIVIAQGGNMDGLHWMEAARSHGYRYAVIAEGAPDHAWPDDGVAERFAACYEAAARAYFVCEANIALSQRQFATSLRHACVIRNPFNVSYDAKPPWPVDSPEELSMACVARLDVGTKRQDLLCEVMNHPRWRDRNVRLSVVGDGPNEKGLRQFANKLKLTKLHFLGFTSDIAEVWSKHNALVLPSRNEGMPLTVVEAMLCGRPCIATDVGGNRELIRDGINGFLAKAPTVELFDEAMNRAWENRHRLREMGEVAARDVRQWVSADPTGDFVRELEALVNGQR
jgi:glycosyltransferase involved in cell wall biosynthesis